jgi:hypothetical protein
MDIMAWLRSLGLAKYEAVFREHDIDETVLPSLTAERSALVEAVVQLTRARSDREVTWHFVIATGPNRRALDEGC